MNALSPIPAKPKRQSVSRHSKLDHRIASKAICDGLILGEGFAVWSEVAAILAHRFTVKERGALAWCALKALEPDDAVMVADAVLGVCPKLDTPSIPYFAEVAAEYRQSVGVPNFGGNA